MKLLVGVAVSVLLLGVSDSAKEPSAEGKSVSYWVGALGDSDMATSLHASMVLSKMGKKALPFLLRVLREDHSDVRGNVLTTLGMMRLPDAEGAMPAISALLHDESATIRVTAAATLVSLDCERRGEAWPTLVAALEGGGHAAVMAAGTIGSLGSDGAPAVQSLVALLGSTDAELRLRVMAALGSVGPSAHAAIPALREVASEGGPIAAAAEAAIERIGNGALAVPSCAERRRQWLHR